MRYDDTLNGAGGADTLLGGANYDTYILSDVYLFVPSNEMGKVIPDPTKQYLFDQVTELAGRRHRPGQGHPVTNGTAYTLTANVENGQIQGTGAFRLNGNTLANKLTGNSGANTLSGGHGNDTLKGGLGNDSLAGGNGTHDAADFSDKFIGVIATPTVRRPSRSARTMSIG